MTDAPQGPGWWQASDGRWYPPESHPDHQLTQQQSAVPRQPSVEQPVEPPIEPPAERPWYLDLDLDEPEPTPAAPAFPPAAFPPAAALPPEPTVQQPTVPYGYLPPEPTVQQPTVPYGYQPPEPQQHPQPQPQHPQYGYQQPFPLGGAHAGGPAPMAPPSGGGRGKVLVGVAVLVVLGLLAALLVVLVVKDDSGDRARDDVLVSDEEELDPTPDDSFKKDADVEVDVDIIGAEEGELNDVISAAIADVEGFWTDQYPSVYGDDWEPVSGGFYSWSPGEDLPPCADVPENVENNAYYCGDFDNVAWDDTELVPSLYETYGDLSVAIVFAHEWGHAVQFRAGLFGESATVTLEQQADCFAGAWVSHVQSGDSDFFTADGRALDQALAGFLELADAPGTSASDPNAHGSAFDRINSFKEGLDDGTDACSTYDDQSVGSRLVELEFQTFEDFQSGGNAPLEDDDPCEPDDLSGCGVVSLSAYDLDDYFSTVDEEFDATWEPLEPVVPFDASSGDAPECGDADTEGYRLFYCVDERFVAYDSEELIPELYDSLGDFAVATLIGSQYSLAAQEQFDIAPDKALDQNLMADCMTGAWTASVFNQDRTDAKLILSPGDFDEAIKVLLTLGASKKESTQGTGFERVSAFREGVLGGIGACAD